MDIELKRIMDKDCVNGKAIIPKSVISLGEYFLNTHAKIEFEEDSSLEIIKRKAFSTSIYQNELNFKDLKHLKILEDESLQFISSFEFPHIKVVLPENLKEIGVELFEMAYENFQEIEVSFKTSKTDLMFALNNFPFNNKLLDTFCIGFYDFEKYAPKDTLFKRKMTLREFENAIADSISLGKNLIN